MSWQKKVFHLQVSKMISAPQLSSQMVSLLAASFMGKLLLLLTSVTKLDNKKYFHKANKLQDISGEFPGSHFLFIFRNQRKWSNSKENPATLE